MATFNESLISDRSKPAEGNPDMAVGQGPWIDAYFCGRTEYGVFYTATISILEETETHDCCGDSVDRRPEFEQ